MDAGRAVVKEVLSIGGDSGCHAHGNLVVVGSLRISGRNVTRWVHLAYHIRRGQQITELVGAVGGAGGGRSVRQVDLSPGKWGVPIAQAAAAIVVFIDGPTDAGQAIVEEILPGGSLIGCQVELNAVIILPLDVPGRVVVGQVGFAQRVGSWLQPAELVGAVGSTGGGRPIRQAERHSGERGIPAAQVAAGILILIDGARNACPVRVKEIHLGDRCDYRQGERDGVVVCPIGITSGAVTRLIHLRHGIPAGRQVGELVGAIGIGGRGIGAARFRPEINLNVPQRSIPTAVLAILIGVVIDLAADRGVDDGDLPSGGRRDGYIDNQLVGGSRISRIDAIDCNPERESEIFSAPDMVLPGRVGRVFYDHVIAIHHDIDTAVVIEFLLEQVFGNIVQALPLHIPFYGIDYGGLAVEFVHAV